MKKYTFLVYHKQYEDFLGKLREAGVLHVATKPEGVAENDLLRDKMQLSAKIKKTIAEAEKQLPEGTTAHLPDNSNGAALLQVFDDMLAEKQRLQQAIANTQKEAAQMTVWGDYNTATLQKLRDAGYVLQFFTCQASRFCDDWLTDYNAFVVAQAGTNLYFVTVNREMVNIEADTVQLNEHNAAQLATDAEAQRHLLVAQQAKIEAWTIVNLNNLREYLMQVEQGIDWQKVELNTTAAAEDKVMLLEGFCPVENEQALNTILDETGVYYEVSNPEMGENIPIKLKNNFFARLFEPITKLYSLPNYSEIDPTALFAPFFMLFFGLCMGDGGYGLFILAVATIVKFKKPQWRNWATLGQFMGLATILAGILTGTFFGIMLDSVTWPWLANVKQYFLTSNNYADRLGYDPMMILAIALGVVQIFFGMGVKGVKIAIQHGFKYAASTFAWLVGLMAAMVLLIPMLGVTFPLWFTYTLYGIAGLCVFVILFYNTPGKNPFINFGSGLWGTYNMVSGLLGDVLSYIRLFALGLAGGILGNVFNSLAMDLGSSMPGYIGWLPMLLVLLIGHGLNFFLCVISAVVHPMRLTFVEFYKNAGFEGGGQAYNPFRQKDTVQI